MLTLKPLSDDEDYGNALKKLMYFLRHVSETNETFRSIQEYYLNYESLEEDDSESEGSLELVSMKGRSLDEELSECDLSEDNEPKALQTDSRNKENFEVEDDESSPVEKYMRNLSKSYLKSETQPKMINALPGAMSEISSGTTFRDMNLRSSVIEKTAKSLSI